MDDKYPTEEQIREILEAFRKEGKEGIEKVLVRREEQKVKEGKETMETDSSEKTE